eukprot:scaffold140141_cov22-Tisochrysis_lutea.AAC.1
MYPNILAHMLFLAFANRHSCTEYSLYLCTLEDSCERKRKPDWMKRPPVPGGEKYLEIKEKLRELKLHTNGLMYIEPASVYTK